MSVTLRHSGLTETLTRFEFADLIAQTGRYFDLSKTAITLISHYIKQRTSDDDYIEGRICAVWPRVNATAIKTRLSVRSINNAERELAERGFIIRTTGRNGFRDGERSNDGSKQVVWACGVNLQPAIDRAAEILEKAEEVQLEELAVKATRSEIRYTNKLIRQLENPNLLQKALEILPNGRSARVNKLERLNDILESLKQILTLVDSDVGTAKSSDASAEDDAPIYESIKSNNSSRHKPKQIEITSRLVLKISADEFRQQVVDVGDYSWRGIANIASYFARGFGISARRWTDICSELGERRAAVCIIIIHRNSKLSENHHYFARSPAACFNGMVKAIKSGKTDLNGLIGSALERAIHEQS